MTKDEINRAVDRMTPEDRAALREIVYSNSPTKGNEARWLVGIYHQFPTRGVVQDLPPFELPSFVRAEVQREWEAWV